MRLRGAGPWSLVDAVFFRSLYWPGSGAGNPPVRASSAETEETTRTIESILIPSLARKRPPFGSGAASEESMMRMRTTSALTVAVVLGLSLAAAGCGKYSWGALKAQKDWKDANALYQAPTGRARPRSTNRHWPVDPRPGRDFLLPRQQLRQHVQAEPRRASPRTTRTSRRRSRTTRKRPRRTRSPRCGSSRSSISWPPTGPRS